MIVNHLTKAECAKCDFNCMLDFIKKEDVPFLDEFKVELDYSSGDTIIKQGSYVAQILYVKKGLVKTVIEEKNKKSTILKIVGPGNFLALPVLSGHNKYPMSVISLSDSVLCLINKDSVMHLLKKNAALSNELISRYSDDYLFLYSKIATLSMRNSHGKLATALLYLSGEQFNNTNIFDYVTRKDLADLAAISLESANKILQELKSDRIIEIENRNISVLRPELLQTLSLIG